MPRNSQPWGAFSRATVGWFDREQKAYRKISDDEQCEVISLVGDIASGEDGPVIHAHAVLGLPNGHVRGGHLLDGEVWPTPRSSSGSHLRRCANPSTPRLGSPSSTSSAPRRTVGHTPPISIGCPRIKGPQERNGNQRPCRASRLT
jgi:hypothetical protein